MSKNHTLVAFVKTTYHFFPNLLSWINTIKDPRDTAKTNYPLKDLILVGLLLFIFLILQGCITIIAHLRGFYRGNEDFGS